MERKLPNGTGKTDCHNNVRPRLVRAAYGRSRLLVQQQPCFMAFMASMRAWSPLFPMQCAIMRQGFVACATGLALEFYRTAPFHEGAGCRAVGRWPVYAYALRGGACTRKVLIDVS